jgi:hypothetical protein
MKELIYFEAHVEMRSSALKSLGARYPSEVIILLNICRDTLSNVRSCVRLRTGLGRPLLVTQVVKAVLARNWMA